MVKDVLFEIGLEELPARFIDDAENQLASKTSKWLKDLRIPFETITSFSTPRRLSVLIKDVEKKQKIIKEEVRGPAEKIAKDDAGDWTKAAIGFTKGQGKSVDDIYINDVKGVPYIFVTKQTDGKQTVELLSSFSTVIESITFKEQMYWGTETVRYGRPIRWLVALYGEQVIPFEIAHVETNNITYGHRFLGNKIKLNHPSEYEGKLKDNFVIANKADRKQVILNGIKETEKKESFIVDIDADLLSEVCNLVEYPTVFSGQFQESFLTLPSEALITSMKEHQRYFPVKSINNELLPYFVSVRNGDNQSLQTVVNGNEKVLQARLSDAEFFYEEDQKQSVKLNLEKLKTVVFQEKIGTVSEKMNRMVEITKLLADKLSVDEQTKDTAIRTAEISKFDLVTHMVNEFPELQGVMGEKYAVHFGEDKAVGRAIREHYLPKQANGPLPKSLPGSLVSIADKLDTIVGCLSVGLIPTGSQDPYGLRRQAIGILRILIDGKWNIALEDLLRMALTFYPIDEQEEERVLVSLNIFFKLRATYLLKELDIEQDVVEAVLEKEIGVFFYTSQKATTMSKRRNDEDFKYAQEALVRVLNLSKTTVDVDVDVNLFETPSEHTLFKTYEIVHEKYVALKKQNNAQEVLDQLEQLAEPIHSFFENNMVMDKVEKIQNNRLALLKNIAKLIKDFADLSIIQWNQQV